MADKVQVLVDGSVALQGVTDEYGYFADLLSRGGVKLRVKEWHGATLVRDEEFIIKGDK